jgi:hypothetical protein
MAEDGQEWWLNWWVTDLTEAVGAYGRFDPAPGWRRLVGGAREADEHDPRGWLARCGSGP